MISKNLFSIACGILVWILGVSFYLLSFYVPILENPELQSNIALALGIIPSSYIGTYLFYTKSYIKPSKLGLTFVMVATLLDVIITVPVFIIPNGGSYSEFFGDPMFYTIVVEFYFIVYYFGKHLTNKKIKA
ncbi:DUF5367 family protein [Ichthyenterobacterium sp. W332]|uniref:DUF5367 family protein n=1 Tax=Microcosmobacter mediterraneus TaxID=3075607 RepID=A0ABU2YG77_9FLAO|nr:DUF5367 family protein [Ichthyenterobacterium sp. W332]MDT0557161.1 DUF5367 family protein [Ichthyenterobacterium sp. W332]